MTPIDDRLAQGLRRVAEHLDEQSIVSRSPMYVDRPVKARARSQPRRIVLVGALAVVLAIAGAVAISRDGTRPQEPAAAQGSQRILLDVPGATIERYDEQYEGPGIHAETTFAVGDTRYRLHQRAHDYNDDFMQGEHDLEVLGEQAHLIGEGGEFRAFWRHGAHDLELRGPAIDEAAFRDVLTKLRAVDEATFEAALPADVITPTRRPAFVEDALRDVPLPDRFDVEALRRDQLVNDRYQATARVMAPVLCRWFTVWSDARGQGDVPAEERALAALRSSKDWMALQAMASEGDYPRAVEDTVAMLAGPSPKSPGGGPADVTQLFSDGIGCTPR
jgi:hypothetical protein